MTALQLQLLMMFFAGWVNRSQQDAIEYLQAENRVLREQLGDGRLLLTDGQRRRLARRAKVIGRKGLFELDIDGSVECGERLGGVLKYYDRRAA